MSTEIVCDQCGKRVEPGIAAFDWWEISRKADGVELDFCSAACAAAFLTACARAANGESTPTLPAVHSLGERNGI